MYSFKPIAMCCGLDTKDPNENYWRNRHMIGEGSSLTLAYPASAQLRQQQPYMLLTRPVILTNQNNQSKPFLAHSLQPQLNYVASPYATIYNAQNRYDALMSNSFFNSPLRRIENPYLMNTTSVTSNNLRMNINDSFGPQNLMQHQQHHGNIKVNPNSIVLRNDVRKIGTLSSEVFRQLEAVEKQFDMSIDMDAVEKRGEVITHELESDDLSRCIDEDTIRRYHDQYLVDPECYLIRFVEIIKRPGQTLGLYIRTVTFDDAPNRIPSREGVIITKIGYDSPVFNGNVLNVGDEILSVNLVDIQGMSLDDVVIIMSIPKRLILALRSPKYREQPPPPMMPRPGQMTITSSRSMHQQPIQQIQAINSNNSNENEPRPPFISQTISNNVESGQHLTQRAVQHQHPHHQIHKQNRNLDFDAGQEFASESYTNNSNNINKSSVAISNYSNHLHHSPSVVADYRPYDLSQFRPASQMSIHRPSYASMAPSTGYRNLPTRAQFSRGSNMLPSNTEASEPTSYFSSSIDAINRELKELRRQRMALDNLNNNISSLDFNDSSIDDDRPIILPSQINLYSSLPNTMTRAQRLTTTQSIKGEPTGMNSEMLGPDLSANRDNLTASLGHFEGPTQTAAPRTPRILPSPPNTTNMSDTRSQSAFPDYGQLSCT